MKGIKKHKHADRERIIRELVPLIKKKFGSNLVALAVCCSFARNEDTDFSDLELTAFVRTMPEGTPRGGMAKMYNGTLIELLWMTRETYLKTTLDVNEYWHYSGSDRLLPIINEEFISELNEYRQADRRKKCLEQAVGCFSEYQEAVSKVLNAVVQDNREGVSLLFFDMINQTLRLLSFLNEEPYVTASRMIAQAKGFALKPRSLDRLLAIAERGSYGDLEALREVTVSLFEEFESIFEGMGLPLYDDNFDPNIPVHKHRQM